LRKENEVRTEKFSGTYEEWDPERTLRNTMASEKGRVLGPSDRSGGALKKLYLHEGQSQGDFRGSVLSLMDLEIPSRRLLTRNEEKSLGQKVQSGFRRLEKLLPRTLSGYERYLQRMAEVQAGSVVSTAWFSLGERLPHDLLTARKQMEKAKRLARRSPRRAEKALLEGAQVLRRYKLDPETRFQWSRTAAVAGDPPGPLGQLELPRKALRILKRTIRIMEEARDQLVLPNFRLILKEVFRYQPIGMKRSDLFQEGILGLHRAVFRFDPGRLTRFSTYATYWIRQAIRKALIDRSRLIRVPQAVQQELRNPDTHLSREEVQRVHRIMRETVSISAGDDDDLDTRGTLDMLGDQRKFVSEKLHTGTIPLAVSRALAFLDSREREVIRRRYGLDGEHIETLEEIGSSLHLSRERIRQIESEALNKMSQSHVLKDVYENLRPGP